MSAAPIEHAQAPLRPDPYGEPPRTLLDQAERLMQQLPGYRVEILSGALIVTPPPDAAHARALSRLKRPFAAAGLDGGETEVLEGLGLWLPDGPENYAVPDLSVVDADIEEHLVENNCYDPAPFRLVLEVTSSNYTIDLRTKVRAYGTAKIPVYVIVDRQHDRLHVLTDLIEDGYDTHRVHARGEHVTLPESIGAEVTLDVSAILTAAQQAPDPRIRR
ncbi:Uma2 family endonuclease [Streptomyces sp. TRM68416]|uniref:Uma2 family endonuclease n=1 Tax=Streptomyces sp. TRM68416 TaxID=2758412 RepID=UPI0016620CFF|nr:Uma2 family endonuclease [Streptomyces sp. TRM68416]MBD0843065.1 Uma2 family endonuclease [Streptomyces sp. TRM68416]